MWGAIKKKFDCKLQSSFETFWERKFLTWATQNVHTKRWNWGNGEKLNVEVWNTEWTVDGYFFLLFLSPISVFRRLKTYILLWQQCLEVTTKTKRKEKKKNIVIHKTNIQTLLTRLEWVTLAGEYFYNIRLERWIYIYRKIVRRTVWRLKIDLKIGICVTENKLKQQKEHVGTIHLYMCMYVLSLPK